MSIQETFWKELPADMKERMRRLRECQPLVHLLTNYVTVNDCVNALLAAGARAICSHAPAESAQVTSGADALVCNLGGTEFYEAMACSVGEAGRRGLPLVIDPVGCGASSCRREMCTRLTGLYREGICVIRGNNAEITALLDGHSDMPGLDSVRDLSEGEEMALGRRMMKFASETGVILIASGETDLCTNGSRMIEIHDGTPALRRITGAGCLSSALVGAFLAVDPSLESAAAAVRLVGLAGESAVSAARGGGTGAGHFHMFLMDALSAGDPVWMRQMED